MGVGGWGWRSVRVALAVPRKLVEDRYCIPKLHIDIAYRCHIFRYCKSILHTGATETAHRYYIPVTHIDTADPTVKPYTGPLYS